jgi:hypothetical protein
LCTSYIAVFRALCRSQGFSFPYFVTLMYLIVKGLECGVMQVRPCVYLRCFRQSQSTHASHRHRARKSLFLTQPAVSAWTETNASAASISSAGQLRYLSLTLPSLPCGVQWCFGLPGRSFNSWWEYFTRVILVGILVGGRCG